MTMFIASQASRKCILMVLMLACFFKARGQEHASPIFVIEHFVVHKNGIFLPFNAYLYSRLSKEKTGLLKGIYQNDTVYLVPGVEAGEDLVIVANSDTVVIADLVNYISRERVVVDVSLGRTNVKKCQRITHNCTENYTESFVRSPNCLEYIDIKIFGTVPVDFVENARRKRKFKAYYFWVEHKMKKIE